MVDWFTRKDESRSLPRRPALATGALDRGEPRACPDSPVSRQASVSLDLHEPAEAPTVHLDVCPARKAALRYQLERGL